MKKLIALLLIFLFLTNINCVITLKSSLYKSESLVTCKVTYIRSSVNIGQGKKWILISNNKSILFKNKEYVLDIPYDKIISMQYDEKLKKVLPRKQDPYFSLYWRENPYANLLVLFLPIVWILAGDFIVELLLKKWSKKNIYFTINYNINNNNAEWITFKIPKNAFNKLYPILIAKTGFSKP